MKSYSSAAMIWDTEDNALHPEIWMTIVMMMTSITTIKQLYASHFAKNGNVWPVV